VNVTIAIAIAWILALPRIQTPHETPCERLERETMIGRSVARAAYVKGWKFRSTGAAVVVIFWAESRLDPLVHAGKPGLGGALCLGQHEPGHWWTKDEQAAIVGNTPEATEACVRRTARVWVSQYRRCRLADQPIEVNAARAFEGYATGGNCEPSAESKKRAAMWVSLRAAYL
jgi:hypothetical protein